MEARKLAAQMAALCPFALVLGVGYTARRQGPEHRVLQYSEAQNQRLEAYRTIVVTSPPSWADPPLIRHHADVWIHVAKVERLQALTPAYQEELTEDNARAEILGKWRTITEQVNHTMRREFDDGDVAQSVRDGARLVRLCEILKYSDFESFHFAASLTSHAVTFLGSALAKVPAGTSRDFEDAVAIERENQGKLPALYKVLRANYDDYLVRRVGFGRELGSDGETASEEDGTAMASSIESLERAYALAQRDEAELRKDALAYLGLRASFARS